MIDFNSKRGLAPPSLHQALHSLLKNRYKLNLKGIFIVGKFDLLITSSSFEITMDV